MSTPLDVPIRDETIRLGQLLKLAGVVDDGAMAREVIERGLVAVNDVSFDVRAGEILGLIGPNGAGKSTTFNLITGLLPATRGEVSLLGRRIDGLSSREIARLGQEYDRA